MIHYVVDLDELRCKENSTSVYYCIIFMYVTIIYWKYPV